MGLARRAYIFRQSVENIFSFGRRRNHILPTVLLGFSCVLLALSGCGQSAQPTTPTSAPQVYSYFGGPFSVSGSALPQSSSAFNHSANQVNISAFISTQTAQVPTEIMNGTFGSTATGFLRITENFASTGSGVLAAENPPVTGAWALEIPGAGVLANFLSLHAAGNGPSVSAGPSAMAANASCPNFSTQTPFIYVTVPRSSLTGDTADYGIVNIGVQGAAVTLTATPFLIGSVARPATTVTGGCSISNLGALTAYPLNSFGTPSNLELISIGASNLLVSSSANSGQGGPGAFGGGSGVIGVAKPSAAVDISSVTAAKYNGFFYAPLNRVTENYDITVLASSFGDDAATSLACSTLQSSLMANNGQGARTVPVLPSANTIYGGEFLTGTGSGAVNDPTGAIGSENCDVAIDLGIQDSANNGLFPNATLFVGSNYPPFSAANPWKCPSTGAACAVSFPSTAVVGKVQGQYVIFVIASAASSPSAQLPDTSNISQSQPVGIYLFQRAQ
jgi:hypothetical protein